MATLSLSIGSCFLCFDDHLTIQNSWLLWQPGPIVYIPSSGECIDVTKKGAWFEKLASMQRCDLNIFTILASKLNSYALKL